MTDQHANQKNGFAPSKRSVRFGIKTALYALTWFAVVFFVMSEFGVANPHFWISSASMFVMAVLSFCLGQRATVVLVLALIALVLFTMAFGPSLAVSLFLCSTVGAAYFVRYRQLARSVCFRLTALTLVFGLLVMWTSRQIALAPIRAGRQRIPIVDLSDRLTHLRKPERFVGNAELWADMHSAWPQSYRTIELTQLHSQAYADFVASPGFGMARAPRLVPERVVELKLPQLAALDEKSPRGDWEPYKDAHSFDGESKESGLRFVDINTRYSRWSRDIDGQPADPWTYYPYAYDENESSFHFNFATIQGFAGPRSLGYLKAPAQSAGFVEHGFHRHPPDLRFGSSKQRWGCYRITQLQLVSLLKFDSPRVYELDQLPRMDLIRDTDPPTRELNDFEQAALERIRLGEDIATSGEDAEFNMVGAIRSMSSCTNCHGGETGDLLGAFSYRFERLQ